MPKLEVVNANNVIEFNPQKANFKLKNTGGPKGEPGAQGPKGDTGPEGPAGPQGIQGEKGDKGAQGERGPQGIQGPQGPQGIQGPKGDKGDKGNTGATGPQGPQGPAGQNGADGQDGADGFSPIATVTQEGLNAEISITDKDGTTTATVPGFGVQVVESLPATGTENVIYLKRTESTASGNPISIADAVEAPLADFKLKGETSQDGTPTPDAPVAVRTVTGENVVKVCGKNIIDVNFTSATGNGVTKTLNADGSITLNGHTTAGHSFTFSNDFIVEAGQTYTLSVEILSGSFVPYNSNQNWAVQTNLNDPNASPQTVSANPLTTSGINVQYTSQTRRTLRGGFWFGYNSSTTSEMATFNNFTFRVQVEKGSTATTYEPYQGQSYTLSLGTLELCKIDDYQDYIYKSGGKWYVHKECGVAHLPGDLSAVGISDTNTAGVKRFGIGITGSSNVLRALTGKYPILCSILQPGDRSDTYAKRETIGYGIDGTGIYRDFSVYIAACNAMTTSQFQSWVNSNPFDIVYILATPTDTEITNEALVGQLEAILSQGHTYAGTNNITTVISAGNEQGELEIGYYNAYDSYLYVAGRWQQFARLTAANE